MGAALAMRHALDYPESIDGLVLLAPLMQVSGARSPVLRPETWYRLAEVFLHFTRVIENPVPLDVRDADVRNTHPLDRFVAREVFHALFPLVDDIQTRAAELDHPVLMVVSPHDVVVDSDAARVVFDRIASSDKQLFIDEDSAHVTPLDFGWRRVADAVCEHVRNAGHFARARGKM